MTVIARFKLEAEFYLAHAVEEETKFGHDELSTLDFTDLFFGFFSLFFELSQEDHITFLDSYLSSVK